MSSYTSWFLYLSYCHFIMNASPIPPYTYCMIPCVAKCVHLSICVLFSQLNPELGAFQITECANNIQNLSKALARSITRRGFLISTAQCTLRRCPAIKLAFALRTRFNENVACTGAGRHFTTRLYKPAPWYLLIFTTPV